MMSLQKDNDMMADEAERDGADLAAPNFKNDGGLEAHNDNKNYLTDVPDLVGAGRRFRPSPTISSHGDAHEGYPIESRTDWSAGYALESSRGLPRGNTEYNGDAPKGAAKQHASGRAGALQLEKLQRSPKSCKRYQEVANVAKKL